MPLPKRRHSSTRRDKRRTHDVLKEPIFVKDKKREKYIDHIWLIGRKINYIIRVMWFMKKILQNNILRRFLFFWMLIIKKK
jgi:hypothetical protein